MDDPTDPQAPAAPPPAAGDTASGSIPPPSPAPPTTATTATAQFDPSRMIGIIKRKALIKKLAAVYHAECLSYCQELLELQRNPQEPFLDSKAPDDSKKEMGKPPKRAKRNR